MFAEAHLKHFAKSVSESQSGTINNKPYQLTPQYRTIGGILILITGILLVSGHTIPVTPNSPFWPDLAVRPLASRWWRIMLETSSNAYFPWGPTLATQPEIKHQALLIGGTSLVLLPQLGLTLALASSLAMTLLLATCLPEAPVVPWSVASAMPMVFLALRLSLACPISLRILLAITGGSLAALALNQLSPVFIALAWLLLASKLPPRLAIPNTSRTHIKPGLIALSLAVPLAVTISAPKITFPNYPEGARLVDDYGVPGFARPLVGVSPPTKIVDRVAVKLKLRKPARVALGMMLMVVAAAAVSERRFALLPILVGIATLVDILAPEWLAQIGPIQALARLVPGMVLFNLAPIAFVSAIILITLSYPSLPIAIASLIASLIIGFRPPTSQVSLRELAVAQPEIEQTISKFTTKSPFEPPHLSPEELVIFSPSFALFRRLGTSYPFKLHNAATEPLIRRRVRATTLSSSSNTIATPLKLATDHNPATRWSPGGGRQEQGSWLKISLPHPEPIAGLVLDVGPFASDFPRNFKVTTATNCSTRRSSSNLEPPEQPTSLHNFTPWRGPVLWTTDGYPYFGLERDVTIIFPEKLAIQCIAIEITKSYPHFDWSVAEVYLLVRERR